MKAQRVQIEQSMRQAEEERREKEEERRFEEELRAQARSEQTKHEITESTKEQEIKL